MAEVEISREYIQSAMQHPAVRAQLGVIADRVARRARSLASSEGITMSVEVEQSIRPGGRPQARVIGDNVGQEWGDSKTAKRRILGRAGEEAS